MYDLKTIQGKSSVINRLRESIGQTNRVLLNMQTDYNARLLASDIKAYFEENPSANEVMLFKGNKLIFYKKCWKPLIIDNKVYFMGASLKEMGAGFCAVTEIQALEDQGDWYDRSFLAPIFFKVEFERLPPLQV